MKNTGRQESGVRSQEPGEKDEPLAGYIREAALFVFCIFYSGS
jgi:hypothetical protein